MINLEFRLADGENVMAYDVHPRSQNDPIAIPPGAVAVVVWLGVHAGPVIKIKAAKARQ